MPRVHTSAVPIAKTITEPGHLIKLAFPGESVLYYSTKGQVTYDTNTYVSGNGARVDRVDENSAAIRMRNTDNSASSLVLTKALYQTELTIYQCYEDNASYVEELFNGYCDSAPSIASDYVTLTAVRRSRNALAPDEYIAWPTFKHLMAAGSTLQWGGDTVVLEVPE